jgi:hypothetical protein
VRNDLFRGLNAIKYGFDNMVNTIKSAHRFVFFASCPQTCLVCLAISTALSVYLLAFLKSIPPLYSSEYLYEKNILPPMSPAPDDIQWYNPMHWWQALHFSSTPWLAGIPGLSLHLYQQMCKAIAECVLDVYCVY